MFRAPHFFKIVEGTNLRPEDVDDHIAGVYQHPITGAEPLDVKVSPTGFLQIFNDVIGNRRDVTLGAARSHNHVVGKRRFSDDVDGGNVLSLGVFETGEDDLHGGRRCEFTAGGRKTRGTGTGPLTPKCGCQCLVPSLSGRANGVCRSAQPKNMRMRVTLSRRLPRGNAERGRRDIDVG